MAIRFSVAFVATPSAALFSDWTSIALSCTANCPVWKWELSSISLEIHMIVSNELTIISIQLSKIGIEKTVDMNKPLLSKYCCRENDLQWMAANSFMFSEKYTSNTAAWKEKKVKFNNMSEIRTNENQSGQINLLNWNRFLHSYGRMRVWTKLLLNNWVNNDVPHTTHTWLDLLWIIWSAQRPKWLHLFTYMGYACVHCAASHCHTRTEEIDKNRIRIIWYHRNKKYVGRRNKRK